MSLQSGDIYLYNGSGPSGYHSTANLLADLTLIVDANGDVNVQGNVYGTGAGIISHTPIQGAFVPQAFAFIGPTPLLPPQATVPGPPEIIVGAQTFLRPFAPVAIGDTKIQVIDLGIPTGMHIGSTLTFGAWNGVITDIKWLANIFVFNVLFSCNVIEITFNNPATVAIPKFDPANQLWKVPVTP